MKNYLKTIGHLLGDSFGEWKRHNPFLVGPSIAFYVLFSIAPLLVIIVAIAGAVYGRQAAQGQIVSEIHQVVGRQPAQIIQFIIDRAYSPPSRTLATLLSIPILTFGATMVFIQLRNALNTIWEVEQDAAMSLRSFFRDYLVSFFMVLGTGLLLLGLMAKTPVVRLLHTELIQYLPFSGAILELMDFVLTVLALSLLLAMIYRILPQVELSWRDVAVGSVVTAVLLTAAQLLIGLYISVSDVGSAYGAIGSITVLLVWVYYSSLVFVYGAEFTKVYARRHGSLVERDGVL